MRYASLGAIGLIVREVIAGYRRSSGKVESLVLVLAGCDRSKALPEDMSWVHGHSGAESS